MFMHLVIYCKHRRLLPALSALGIVLGAYYIYFTFDDGQPTVAPPTPAPTYAPTEMCSAQLEYAKVQLEELIKGKDQGDKLLREAQKHRETDKEHVKDVMQSCFLMTQQSVSCQNQLEELKMSCKKNRAGCGKVAEELRQQKTLINAT